MTGSFVGTQRALRQGNQILYDATLAACALALFLGVYFIFGSDAAFTGPVYDNARQVLPIRIFGVLFLAKGCCALIGLVRGRWAFLGFIATVGAGLYVFWALLSGFTASGNHGLGGVGAALWTFIAAIHVLLARSYLRQAP